MQNMQKNVQKAIQKYTKIVRLGQTHALLHLKEKMIRLKKRPKSTFQQTNVCTEQAYDWNQYAEICSVLIACISTMLYNAIQTEGSTQSRHQLGSSARRREGKRG